jgi:pimeloyl-ACP methyl ester carboxylesterase
MKTFTSFDGVRIAYHDEGEGPAVILLHGFGADGLEQYGEFERILPIAGHGSGAAGGGCAHDRTGHARFRSFGQTPRGRG